LIFLLLQGKSKKENEYFGRYNFYNWKTSKKL
jgi:hypothetical protein